jgi:MSHA biogenesis protein MshI
MVYVVAVAKTRIRALVSMIEECGLVLDSIDVPELVLRNLAAHFVGDSDGAAFMDLRGSGSTMNITRAGDLYLSRRINSKLDSNIMQSPDWVAIKARLILEIQRSLDYYESQMGLPAINTLVLVQRRHDGSALADSLSQDLEEGLSSDVRLPPELQQVASIAIGAALRDFTLAIPTRGQRENSEVAA